MLLTLRSAITMFACQHALIPICIQDGKTEVRNAHLSLSVLNADWYYLCSLRNVLTPGVDQNEIVVMLQDFRHAQPAQSALLQSMQEDKLWLLTSGSIVVVAYSI